MSSNQTSPDQAQDEVARLLAIQLRLQLGNQALTIVEMNKAGFSNSRIAALFGTSPDTVKVTVQRAKKAKASTAKENRKPPHRPEARDA